MLALLASTDLPPYADLYSLSWRENASLPLLGNEGNLQRAFDVAVFNLGATDDEPPKFFVVRGVPGAGKSRLGYELLRMWDSPERLSCLQQAAGAAVRVIRLFV